jgi:hypothetical protein
MSEKKTSAWVWVAVGCFVPLVLGVVAFGTLGYFGYRKAKQIETEMKDPQARQAAALRVLHADALPEGYHPMMAFSIPLVMKIAVLSDREPGTSEPGKHAEGFDTTGFIYIELISFGDDDELRDYFEGKTDDASVLRDHNIQLDTREVLRRGVLERGDGEQLLYLTSRGRVEMSRSSADGLMALMLVECPGDDRRRMGIWFGEDPAPEAPVDDPALTGTPADEDAILAFVAPFDFCAS